MIAQHPDASGLSPLWVIRKTFAAGAAGSADDVTVLAAAPFAMRVLSARVVVSTVIAAATCQLRTATAGGGSALSGLVLCTLAGPIDELDATFTATASVAAGAPIYMRRSDRGVAGEYIVIVQPA